MAVEGGKTQERGGVRQECEGRGRNEKPVARQRKEGCKKKNNWGLGS
jgi:hypothetical protein